MTIEFSSSSAINCTSLSDDHSESEPPEPIPNSEVKRFSADGSVGFPHVRVGRCQALNIKPSSGF